MFVFVAFFNCDSSKISFGGSSFYQVMIPALTPPSTIIQSIPITPVDDTIIGANSFCGIEFELDGDPLYSLFSELYLTLVDNDIADVRLKIDQTVDGQVQTAADVQGIEIRDNVVSEVPFTEGATVTTVTIGITSTATQDIVLDSELSNCDPRVTFSDGLMVHTATLSNPYPTSITQYTLAIVNDNIYSTSRLFESVVLVVLVLIC